MFRLTSVLIVMTLTASPAARIGCEIWCGSAFGRVHHQTVGCHDVSLDIVGPGAIVQESDCGNGSTISPFLAEARQSEVVAAAANFTSVLRSFECGDTAIPLSWRAFAAAKLPAPALHAILRL
jgi:hypothetical protein